MKDLVGPECAVAGSFGRMSNDLKRGVDPVVTESCGDPVRDS